MPELDEVKLKLKELYHRENIQEYLQKRDDNLDKCYAILNMDDIRPSIPNYSKTFTDEEMNDIIKGFLDTLDISLVEEFDKAIDENALTFNKKGNLDDIFNLVNKFFNYVSSNASNQEQVKKFKDALCVASEMLLGHYLTKFKYIKPNDLLIRKKTLFRSAKHYAELLYQVTILLFIHCDVNKLVVDNLIFYKNGVKEIVEDKVDMGKYIRKIDGYTNALTIAEAASPETLFMQLLSSFNEKNILKK